MTVPSHSPFRRKKTKALGLPTIDLSLERSRLPQLIVKACQEFGFFKVVNHRIPSHTIARMERAGLDFFAKPASEKHKAGPPSPFGYGCKNIGFNGDKGELEYILMEANPLSVCERSKTISDDPNEFSCAMNDYVQAVRNLACEILDLVAEGLSILDKAVFSKLIRDINSDSCFRINYYPPYYSHFEAAWDPKDHLIHHHPRPTHPPRVGFGEHSDPQILTIMRSNDVAGLQICSPDGFWVSVPPDPSEFCVFVGEAFQALTNGRFVSVRHRALANSSRQRLSIMYFGAPPLNAWISPLPQLVSTCTPDQYLYRPFTWGEYKKAAYSSRLGDRRLDLFKCRIEDDSLTS